MAEDMTLPERFREMASMMIGPKGVYPHLFLWQEKDGTGEDVMSVESLALDPKAAIAYVAQRVHRATCGEAVYGLDRFTKPGQGTALGDLIAGRWRDAAGVWRPFIIEYQHKPRIVQPLDWGNEFWNDMLAKEAKGRIWK